MDTNKSKETVRILMKDNNYQEISQEEFSTRLLSAREDERKMIARNLHDGLGQMLTVLSFDLVRITKMLETEQSVVAPLVSDLLTNVARHSKATRLNINLKVINDEVTFVIADNGRGITEDEVSSIKSIGILGIKERVSHSNGNIKFFGISGKGTTVTMSFPVNN